jgi:hypothetical protein
MGCCVATCYEQPPSPPHPPSHLAHHFTCLQLCLSGLEGKGEPPPHTPSPMVNSEAAAADIEDGL